MPDLRKQMHFIALGVLEKGDFSFDDRKENLG